MIFRENSGKNFTNISNNILQCEDLSYKARGIAVYLLSKHEDWETSIEDLKNNSPKEGRDSIRSGLEELADAGFATLNKIREVGTGKFLGERWFLSDNKDWVLKISGRPSIWVINQNGRYRMSKSDDDLEIPAPDLPASGFSDAGFPGVREIQHNKEKNKQKKESNKENTSTSKTQKEQPEYLLKDSKEWKLVKWWHEELISNDLLPPAMSRKRGRQLTSMLEKWAKVINELHRIDEYSYDDILKVLQWLLKTKNYVDSNNQPQKGNFWFTKAKFSSLSTLRAKTRSNTDITKFDSMWNFVNTDKPLKQTDNFQRG